MEIELYGHYYFRGEDHIPRRITIVEQGPAAGFYWYVDGHVSKEEFTSKNLEKHLIHKNRITL